MSHRLYVVQALSVQAIKGSKLQPSWAQWGLAKENSHNITQPRFSNSNAGAVGLDQRVK